MIAAAVLKDWCRSLPKQGIKAFAIYVIRICKKEAKQKKINN